MYKRLSYDHTQNAPVWPGNFSMEMEPYTLIGNGDVSNQYKVTMLNHFGSHMDGPRHFNDDGPRLAEMPLETFIYERPLLIDIPKSFAEFITVHDLQAYEQQIKEADILMVRSGFSAYRSTDTERYASEGPGFRSDACRYLMDTAPQLKAVAMDWISLASYTNPQEGELAHQYLLGKFHDHYICIIEDVHFEGIENDQLKRVFSMPLFTDTIDSSPVTVIAEI